MRGFLLISTLLLGASALPQSTDDEFEILKYRNWDLRLSLPGCTPNTTNLKLSLYHRGGVYTRDCVSLLEDTGPDAKPVNLSRVDTVSWKNKRLNYDLCLYPSADCSDQNSKAIRNGWEVCLPYEGWEGYRIVEAGDTCTVEV
ncbi:uncharacterized protein KD926_007746 [Aspergillus affinis]|uniref:uncharacterized protein n=1 Tax=Aspergillus affinis TaxID=1070780 RepID=UPI0022FEA759|nr:uncharacterized protein KD926_007746 [Aspergillus affinis]KAI9040802.1 hypothetical protein KD926_007746 [Aspergillus affinis]